MSLRADLKPRALRLPRPPTGLPALDEAVADYNRVVSEHRAQAERVESAQRAVYSYEAELREQQADVLLAGGRAPKDKSAERQHTLEEELRKLDSSYVALGKAQSRLEQWLTEHLQELRAEADVALQEREAQLVDALREVEARLSAWNYAWAVRGYLAGTPGAHRSKEAQVAVAEMAALANAVAGRGQPTPVLSPFRGGPTRGPLRAIEATKSGLREIPTEQSAPPDLRREVLYSK